MSDPGDTQGKIVEGSVTFSWETLPELAKNRWEEAVAFDVTMENRLVRAKASRSLAERERQRIAGEILEATKEVCEEIIAEGQRARDRARQLESQAVQKYKESQGELEQAQALRVESEGYREKIMAEVEREANEALNRARATAEQECLKLKDSACLEARRMMDQAEVMRAAAEEELETQRIYTEAARLKAESQEVLALIRSKRSEPVTQPAEDAEWEAVKPAGADVHAQENPTEDPGEPFPQDEPVSAASEQREYWEEKPAEETPKELAKATSNGKKPARRPVSTK